MAGLADSRRGGPRAQSCVSEGRVQASESVGLRPWRLDVARVVAGRVGLRRGDVGEWWSGWVVGGRLSSLRVLVLYGHPPAPVGAGPVPARRVVVRGARGRGAAAPSCLPRRTLAHALTLKRFHDFIWVAS